MSGFGTAATFKKGMVVRVKEKEFLWKPATPEHIKEWGAVPHNRTIGDDGETRLPPRHMYRESDGLVVYKIQKARVSVERGYHTISGCAEVVDAGGEVWWVSRSHLH